MCKNLKADYSRNKGPITEESLISFDILSKKLADS